jgi:hypothetical protein
MGDSMNLSAGDRPPQSYTANGEIRLIPLSVVIELYIIRVVLELEAVQRDGYVCLALSNAASLAEKTLLFTELSII